MGWLAMILTRLKKLVGSLLAGALLTGCEAPRKPVVTDLQYPVLVVFPGSGYERFNRAEDLNDMSLQRVIMYKDIPLLIDSGMRIYQLADLKSTKSGLSIMVSAGVGRTPVTFNLVATKDAGLPIVRDILIREYGVLREGHDAEQRREQLDRATTIEQIIESIQTRR